MYIQRYVCKQAKARKKAQRASERANGEGRNGSRLLEIRPIYVARYGMTWRDMLNDRARRDCRSWTKEQADETQSTRPNIKTTITGLQAKTKI